MLLEAMVVTILFLAGVASSLGEAILDVEPGIGSFANRLKDGAVLGLFVLVITFIPNYVTATVYLACLSAMPSRHRNRKMAVLLGPIAPAGTLILLMGSSKAAYLITTVAIGLLYGAIVRVRFL
jgi:uncharacterized SAM-binding protein YcdF (DUF218 family)